MPGSTQCGPGCRRGARTTRGWGSVYEPDKHSFVVLDTFLKTAIEMDADVLEFEYDCGKLIVMASRGATGVSMR